MFDMLNLSTKDLVSRWYAFPVCCPNCNSKMVPRFGHPSRFKCTECENVWEIELQYKKVEISKHLRNAA